MMQKQCLRKRPAGCKFRKGQSGIAMITVVAVFAILVIVIGATIIIATTENSTSQNSVRAEQALAYAEAGIDWAAAKLRTTSDLSTTTTYLAISGASVGVTITNIQPTNTITVVSHSVIPAAGNEYPAASRAIRVTFTTTQSFAAGGSLFKRAITADGRIIGKNNTEIHVSSNLPMEDGISILSNYGSATPPAIDFTKPLKPEDFDGNAGIVGTATANGIPSGHVIKTVPDPVPTLTETSTEIIALHTAAIAEGHDYTGAQNWESGITLNGIYFVHGDVTINNKLDGTGTLVVTGKLTTKNKTNWGSNSMALIILGSADLEMKNNPSITGYIYCGGNITFKNSFSLVGGMTLKGNVEFWNNADITYQDLGEGGYYNPAGFSTTTQLYSVSSWQEVAP